MMGKRSDILTPLALSLVFALSGVAAQDRASMPEHGIPGSMPGTERWIITLQERPFKLAELRSAILTRQPEEKIQLIISGLEEKVDQHQAGLARFVDELGGQMVRQWWLINGCAVEIPFAAVEKLRQHPQVRQLYPDQYKKPSTLVSTNAWNHNADAVHKLGITGKGVTIAVPDSGFDVDCKTGTPPYKPNPTFYVNGNQNNTTGGGLKGSRLVRVLQTGTYSVDNFDQHGTSVTAIAGGEAWQGPWPDQGQAPGTSLAVYAWPVLPNSYSSITIMVATWQQIVTDSSKYNILVANNSYEGSAPPEWPEQQAMDAAVLTADIFIAAMCGNRGKLVQPTHWSNGATNILAVGSVEANTRRVSDFSSRGPLWWATTPHPTWHRNYPDLVANGEWTWTPKADGGTYTGKGTSYSAPQVVGAAALYRSVKTRASALETRAAILATLQDIRSANTAAPYNTRNAYGMGYLRTDHLIKAARGAGTVFTGSRSATTGSSRFKFAAKAGVRYAVALSWNRLIVTDFDWSDLDLEVKLGSTSLGASKTKVGNTNERVTFSSKTAATVDIIVTSTYMELKVLNVPFCVYVVEETPVYDAGIITKYGQGCIGTGLLVPSLDSNSIPINGFKYTLALANVNLKLNPSLILTGVSNTNWGSTQLPLNLRPFGAPKCNLLTDIVFTQSLTTNNLDMAIPLTTVCIGASLYHQSLVMDLPANAAGIINSNGLKVKIGGSR